MNRVAYIDVRSIAVLCVQENAVLSYGVVIDRKTRVPAGCKISLMRPPALGASFGRDSESEEEGEVPYAASSIASFGGGVASPHGFGDGKSSLSGRVMVEGDDDDVGGGGDSLIEAPSSRPEPAVVAAALAVARGGIPETTTDFDADIVGPLGAGFLWERASSVKVQSGSYEMLGKRDPQGIAYEGMLEALSAWERAFEMEEAEVLDVNGGMVQSGSAMMMAQEMEGLEIAPGASDEMMLLEGQSMGSVLMPGMSSVLDLQHFKNEVAETFLRCVKEGISQENVVIELNGLKIAEDKTFADCARYMLTTALGLSLPPPSMIPKEYRALYPANELDGASREGRYV